MIKNRNIICISSIDWDFIWQGHQEIMSGLAKTGNRILFIENTGVRAPGIRDFARIRHRIKNWLRGVKGIRQEMANLYIFSPIVLPFPYLRIARWINRHLILSILEKWIRIADFYDAIIWTFLPTPLSMDIINNLQHRGLVYYCIDNFRASSSGAKRINQYEIKLLKQADLVFVTSKALYDHSSNYNQNVHSFPFAVNFPLFEKVRKKETDCPEELRGIKKPIIGYVGGVHKWVDQKLIAETAQACPDYSFVFIGPLQIDVSALSEIKNIYFLGKKEHKDIPYLVKFFDLCIIPYVVSDYTKNVYPTKLNEYHALGKPVIATAVPEIINFNKENDNLVFVCEDAKGFVDCIEKAVSPADSSLIEKRVNSAKNNSWHKRIEGMSLLIKEMLENKSHTINNLPAKLLNFYRRSRRKIFPLIAGGMSAYLLLFYTPLVWFLARPLKISQPAKTADCIVVLGGGVGESGRAGQGYEERVQHAVDLYERGFARNIIFSSGYSYAFKETMVMKALAVSLGIPERVIILENQAANTYQNVLFTKDILNKNGWDSMLLISSPYHMRRVWFVFKKIGDQIDVTYSPLPNSLFYARENRDQHGRRAWKQITSSQIRGIAHEYLGIIYYWYKGWIR